MEAFLDMASPLYKRQDSWGSAPEASSTPAAPSPDSSAGSSYGAAPSTASTGLTPIQQYIAAHALLSTLGFVVALPIGALVARWVRTHSDRWFRAHWIIQWVVAFPLILTGFALGVASVARNDRLALGDTHKRWGVALFCLYLLQLGLGALVHFVKVPFLQYRNRAAQNYAHGALGVFIIGAGFYQVRTGFRTEWPAYAGTKVGGGANVVWIIWLVLVVTAYAVGLGLLPRQYAQEHAARRRRGYQTDSTELMAKQQGPAFTNVEGRL